VNAGKLLFAQLMDFLPWTSFARSVARYGGDRRVRSLSCAEQFSRHGVCPVDLSRESARHRSMSQRTARQALPHGLSFSVRVPPWPKPTRAAIGASMPNWRHRLMVQARKLYAKESLAWTSTAARLRAGLDHHRPVPELFPGRISVPPSPPSR